MSEGENMTSQPNRRHVPVVQTMGSGVFMMFGGRFCANHTLESQTRYFNVKQFPIIYLSNNVQSTG